MKGYISQKTFSKCEICIYREREKPTSTTGIRNFTLTLKYFCLTAILNVDRGKQIMANSQTRSKDNSFSYTNNFDRGWTRQYIGNDLDSILSYPLSWKELAFRYSKYKWIGTGRTNLIRDTLDVDVDTPFTDRTIEEVKALCSSNSVPLPNWVLINNTSLHYHLGWLFDQPFVIDDEGDQYSSVLRVLSGVFGGDNGMVSVNCRNPYCKDGQTITWLNEEPSKKKAFKPFMKKTKKADAKPVEETYTIKPTDDIMGFVDSRNNFSMRYADREVLRYMGKHHGEQPSLGTVKIWVIQAQTESLKYNNKKNIQPDHDITAIAQSALKFGMERFRKGRGNQYDETDRRKALLNRQVVSWWNGIQASMLRAEGKNNTQIAKELGITRRTVINNAQRTDDYVVECFKEYFEVEDDIDGENIIIDTINNFLAGEGIDIVLPRFEEYEKGDCFELYETHERLRRWTLWLLEHNVKGKDIKNLKHS